MKHSDNVAKLAAAKDIPVQRLLDIAIAERDGRLVVLPPDKAQWIKAILAERDRQDQKWGYPKENTYCEWSSILAEETGELAKELNELNFGRGDRKKMETEAVQVAAVALEILEEAAVAHSVTARVAADVEPVRHGKYTSTGHDEVYCDFGVCSLCGHWMVAGSNYCPNCGAKMDGEVGSDG